MLRYASEKEGGGLGVEPAAAAAQGSEAEEVGVDEKGPAMGVGAAIRSIQGEPWGFVVADDVQNKSWKLSTGRVAKKATHGLRWDWECNVDWI